MATKASIFEMSGVANDQPKKTRWLQGGVIGRVTHLLERSALARAMGISFGGQRNLWDAFGWDTTLSIQGMYDMYCRGGIAKRIIEAKPDSTWGRPPRIYLAEHTEWTSEFAKLAWDLDLWVQLRKADVLASLARFSILLIGTNRGALAHPIPKGGAGQLKITYLQPYGETQVKIKKWDEDPMSPRFGKPLLYTIAPTTTVRQQEQAGVIEPDVRPQGSSFDVHFSRVLHISRGSLQNNVYGLPDYAPIWNYLTDLLKVIGASSESYWMQAYPGLHANIDKDMDLDEEDEANLTAEMDEYQHSLRRFIRTRGVEVENIGSKVADPRGSFDVLVTLISGTTGIPKRILLGSEAGQLASSQDKANWAERIEENRELHAEPNILWPFVMWVIENRVLPLPESADPRAMRALWPDAYRMSPLERAQTSAQIARSLANINKGLQPIVIEEAVEAVPGTPESSDPITGEAIPAREGVEGKAAVTEDPLLSRAEARRILGLSTDMKLLAELPEDQG